MKKIIILVVLLCLFIIIFFGYKKYYDARIDILIDDVKSNYSDLISDNSIYVISLSDGQSMIKEFFNKDINIVRNEAFGYLKKNHEVKYIKLDIGYNIAKGDLSYYIKNSLVDRFNKNLIINDSITLLNSEINYNNLLDYKKKSVNEKKMIEYILKRDDVNIKEIIKIETFDSASSFLDSDSKIYHLDSKEKNFHIRKEELGVDYIQLVLEESKDFLINMIDENGKFIYGYDITLDKELGEYNILRHSLAIWALLKNYELTDYEKGKVDKSIEYLISKMVYYGECAFVVEECPGFSEIKLGANGVALTALCEYMKKYKTDKYIELAKQIGNGIIYCQNENGSFIHVLNLETFDKKADYRTILYDGEAVLGLCSLYSLVNDNKYYESATLSVEYFIDNNYYVHNDHWISYAFNAYTKLNKDEKYLSFALKNVWNNYEDLKYENSTHHASFEQLFECYDTYCMIKENDIELDIMKDFPIEKLKILIDYRKELEYGAIMLPESFIYTKNPARYCNIFYLRNNLTVQIDDLAHYINAFSKLNSYMEK